MRSIVTIVVMFLLVLCHVAIGRPFDSFDEIMGEQPTIVYKRANGGNQQELVMARLQQLLGPEAFTEMDSHGRLSNLQRLG